MVLENTTAIVVSDLNIQYLFGSLGTLIALSACIAGNLFQTIVKWWDKWQDGQPIPFDRKFIGTAVASFIGAVMISIPLLNAGAEVLNANIPTYGLIIAWFVTAGWAYALNNGVNGVVTKIYNGAETRLIKSGKLDAYIEQQVQQKLAQANPVPEPEEPTVIEQRTEINPNDKPVSPTENQGNNNLQ